MTNVTETKTSEHAGAAAEAEAAEPTGFVLEQGKRFSQSVLWQLTRDYYHQRGLSAWESGTVPSYVTSNPYIAQVYANLVITFLKNCLLRQGAAQADGAEAQGGCRIDPQQPIYIVELAAGHARFSYLFLKKFLALKNASTLRSLDIRYVMTDFTETNLKEWAKQPLFRPFLDQGVLHFALFDLESDEAIRITGDHPPLSAETVKNPLIVLGNYIFDSLTQDYFRVENGKLLQGLITTRAPSSDPPDLSDPEVMSQFDISFDYQAVSKDAFYDDPELDNVLAGYRQRLNDSTVVFPLGPIRALSRLAHIAGQRLLVLSSDKGYTHEDELYYLSGQAIQFHGSFSTMVNYHAMGQFIRGRGGVYVATSQRQLNLKTVALLLGGDADYFADTLLDFRERVDTFGPYDYYTLINHLRVAVQQNLSVDGCMELLRLSHYDPQIFLEFNRLLLENSGSLNDTARAEMQVALEKIWDNFFPLGKDLPFELARMYLAIRRPREALRYNELSLQMFGEHPVTYCNMGICYYHAEDYAEARRYFARSLAINPDYGLPKAWLARVNAEQDRQTC